MEMFLGLYTGIVEKNADPEKLGRLKVRVPHVFGIIGSSVGAISVDDLPWAFPYGMPAGGSAASGGMSWLPEPGDQVMVQFLDGEPEKPVWAWSMQTIDQASSFELHQYDTAPNGSVAAPKRAALTRYGHTVEWNAAGLIATTQHGYRLLLTDGDNSDGQLLLSTGAGQYLNIDDSVNGGTLNISEDFYMIMGQQLNIMCENLRFEATTGPIKLIGGDTLSLVLQGDATITGQAGLSASLVKDVQITSTAANVALTAEIDVTATATGNISLSSTINTQLTFAQLLLGTAPTEPFVLGTQLTIFLQALLLYLDTHTHSNGNFGSPTGPPLIPTEALVQPPVAALISATIFGE